MAALKHTKESIVSELDDRIAAVEAGVNSVGEAIQTEIQQLADAIASGGQVSQADLDRLDALATQLTGDVTALGADDPTPPTA